MKYEGVAMKEFTGPSNDDTPKIRLAKFDPENYPEDRLAIPNYSELRMKYEIIVGNIGSVYNGNSKAEAYRVFGHYMLDGNSTRGAGEDIILLENGEIVREDKVPV